MKQRAKQQGRVPATAAGQTEVTFTPSQWVNIGWLMLAMAGASAVASGGSWIFAATIVWWLWKFAVIGCWQFRISEDTSTIVERKGVFSVEIVEIQYFRIKSIQVRKPFLMRLVGISIIDVITSEPYRPYLCFYAVHNGKELTRFLYEMTDYWREKRGVRESDFHHF